MLHCAALMLFAAAAPAAWDFSSLLERTCSLDRLYEPPGHRMGMASSHDRTLANGDSAGFIRREGERYLMADLQGPGAVIRLWSANPGGRIWIYLDDNPRPVIETEFRRLFLGEVPPFAEPFAHAQTRNDERSYHWSYLPIPFARSCRIYRDKASFFQAGTVRFPAGTAVETLSLPLAPRHQETLRRLAPRFAAEARPAESRRGESLPLAGTVAPGGTVALADLPGPGVIRAIRLRWPEMDPQAGRTATLTAAWEGEASPSVRVPLTDLFAGGFRSLTLGTGADGFGYCYFPMPFRRAASLRITNEGNAPLSFTGELVVERGVELPSPLRTFHASWRRDIETRPARTRAFGAVSNPVCDPRDNHRVAELRGRGHYVGTMHHRYGGSEGDEFILVDGEDPPGSSPGTGNEDYFDMAWGPKTMDSPLAAGASVQGVAGCFRAHLADAIAFERSLEFSFEVFCANTARYDYDSTALWYQEEPHAPFSDLPPAPARRFRTLLRPPDAEYTYQADPNAEGWWIGTPRLPAEGEALEVVASEGAAPVAVGMLDEGPDWSGGRQLLQRSAGPGASFTVKLPRVESDGWHQLRICWTTGPEYGRVRLSANVACGLAPFDGHAAARGLVARAMGALHRARGDNATLKVEVVGKDPRAASAWVGVDWLAQEPTPAPVARIEVAGPLPVLGRVLIPDSPEWRTCPPQPPPTPAQVAEARSRRRELPPAEAVAPVPAGEKDPQEMLLRAIVQAPEEGVYRLDWHGSAPPPASLTVNGATCSLDPRRFARVALGGELPRRFYLPLRAGANELRWQARCAPGQWIAPLLLGTAAPPEGIFEGEDLTVVDVKGPAPRLQMLGGKADTWSRGGHLWFTPTETGSFFEVAVTVRQAGPKTLSAYLTHAHNCGIFQVSVDGKPLGDPYDGYHGLEPDDRSVLRSKEVVFGTLGLAPGEHRIRFTVTGKNERSRGYMVGVDVLRLVTSNP